MLKEKNFDTVTVRPARHDDVHAIQKCIAPFVKHGRILPRTVDELSQLIDYYFVAEHEGEIVGCAVLEVYSKKLSEIRSLAVSEEAHRSGIGKKLVEACIARAKAENILEVMAISSDERFFRSCGFDFTLPGEKKALFYMP